jgi:ketosteroid isomerase-like protein
MQNAAIEAMPEADSDLNTLTQLNLEYVRSVEERDVSWFDRQLAPDFMNSNPDGTLVDRQGFLSQVSRGAGVSQLEAHDVIVRVIGDLAIIHARTTFKLPSGKPGGGRYTDIWSCQGKRWLCVAAHVTRG